MLRKIEKIKNSYAKINRNFCMSWREYSNVFYVFPFFVFKNLFLTPKKKIHYHDFPI